MANPPPHPTRSPKPWLQQCLTWSGRLSHPVVLSAIVTSALVLGVRALGGLQGLELGLYDQMMRLRPAAKSDDRILVVGIDETDIQVRREWPIADRTLAELLEILLASDPRAVGLDLFRDVPIGSGQAELLAIIQSDDRVFPVCKISGPDTPGVPPPAGTPSERVGFSDLVVDAGGILRRSLLAATPPSETSSTASHRCSDPQAQLLSLSLQLALRYLAADNVPLTLTADQEIQLGETVLPRLDANAGGYRAIDAGGYQLMLNFRAARQAVEQVSLSDVLSGRVPPGQIRDRIVLIGATTPEARDDFYTPYSGGLRDSQKMPGVIVHAQATSQILSAVLDGRSLIWSWPTPVEGLWIVLWGIGGALFAWQVRRPLTFTVGATGLGVGLYGLCYGVLLWQGAWVPIVPAALALALAAGGVVLLDRFNKSDYGQAVYKQMKSLLRLDIEIDPNRVGQQVAEITETEYFANLQQQARRLRQQRASGTTSEAPDTTAAPTRPRESAGAETETMDALLDDLKHKARPLQPPDTPDTSPNPDQNPNQDAETD